MMDASIVVAGCEFRENNGYGVSGGMGTGPVSADILDCLFSENRTGVGLDWCYNTTVTGCTFTENTSGGGVRATIADGLLISRCTFYRNSAPTGGGLSIGSWGSVTLDRVIVSYGMVGSAVYCPEGSVISLTCCNIYGNVGGDWVGCIADREHTNGNLSVNPLFCDPEYGNLKLAWLSTCLPENNPCGVQIGAHGLGCYVPVGIDEDSETPMSATKIETYPNPFNPSTTIVYTVPENGPVFLGTYDVSGRLIRTLVHEHRTAGEHRVVWDGKNNAGMSVTSGVYLARLECGGRARSCKITMLR
jgi:hypothetical protein